MIHPLHLGYLESGKQPDDGFGNIYTERRTRTKMPWTSITSFLTVRPQRCFRLLESASFQSLDLAIRPPKLENVNISLSIVNNHPDKW